MAGRHALLIGISTYGEGLKPITSALKDVEAMRDVLLDPGLGGIAADRLQVLTNPGRIEMESAIEGFYANKERDDLLVLYFSGHGFRQDDRQLLLSTSQSNKVMRNGRTHVHRPTTLAAREVREYMNCSRSTRQVVILDCCFSGSFALGMPVKKDAGGLAIEELLGGKGTAVLTSSDAFETSQAAVEGDDLSIYTHFLVEGIRTGVADGDGKGWLSPRDLHRYAAQRVADREPTMTPQFIHTEDGDLIRVCSVRSNIIVAKVPGNSGLDPQNQWGPLAEVPSKPSPTLVKLATSQGRLEHHGKRWQIKQESIKVPCFVENLTESIGITMLQIPEGKFERRFPKHWITLRPYFLGQTLVTQQQWQEVASWSRIEIDIQTQPSYFRGESRPVERVSWQEALEFCRRLSARSLWKYTLPSEAQWEYACRSGTTSKFAYGEKLTSDIANFRPYWSGSYRMKTTDVAIFPANSYGLHDMHGNVWELCADLWHENYEGAPTNGSAWGDACAVGRRVMRGGSWKSSPSLCQSDARAYIEQDINSHLVGFRVCYSPDSN